MIQLLDKIYDGESIVDAQRDFCEVFDHGMTPKFGELPRDEHGIHTGSFRVTIVWQED